jgi:SAM-dependent methyltransferase
MWLNGARPGRLLDLGCGSGKFLRDMRELGWDVAGVDPDPKVASYLRHQYGLDVHQGSLEDAHIAEASFDVVTMNNVIEHLPDPIRTLQAVRRVLRPGGKLVVLTPNIDSMASRAFLSSWVHWDPPRHLFLFSNKTLPMAVQRAGFHIRSSTTSARRAWWTWAISRMIRAGGQAHGGKVGARPWLRVKSMAMHWRQHRASRSKPIGEELLVVAVKPDTLVGQDSDPDARPESQSARPGLES